MGKRQMIFRAIIRWLPEGTWPGPTNPTLKNHGTVTAATHKWATTAAWQKNSPRPCYKIIPPPGMNPACWPGYASCSE